MLCHFILRDLAEQLPATTVMGFLCSLGYGLVLGLFLFLYNAEAIVEESPPQPMTVGVSMVVDASVKIAETDENFICATLDWWPPEKCDYGRCSWVNASILTLDLKNPALANAIRAFSPLKVRLGGTLQDKLLYDVGPLSQPCHDFLRAQSKIFGFSKGCLRMEKWDEIYSFLHAAGAQVIFGLNALYGRDQMTKDGQWGGAWNSSNARSFINYTVDQGYSVKAWEFGNELSGSGIGARVDAKQYAADVKVLHSVLRDIYKNSKEKPLLVAPDGFFDFTWFKALVQGTGPNVLNAVTRHIYNLGPGMETNLMHKILNPSFLDKEITKFRKMQTILQNDGPWASSWVGEAGGSSNSGKHLISDAFVNSFWYLDQLGMAAKFNTKVYCRQSLVGGHYGLLNTTTFAPNPDYYSALLWHRVMGSRALSVKFIGPSHLRAYAHCAKNDTGISLLFINLSNDTKAEVMVSGYPNTTINTGFRESFVYHLKKVFAWAGSKTSAVRDYRMEYHLTPKDGNLQSQDMLLNGALLNANEGNIPQLVPLRVDAGLPIAVSPMSILFVTIPSLVVPACS